MTKGEKETRVESEGAACWQQLRAEAIAGTQTHQMNETAVHEQTLNRMPLAHMRRRKRSGGCEILWEGGGQLDDDDFIEPKIHTKKRRITRAAQPSPPSSFWGRGRGCSKKKAVWR